MKLGQYLKETRINKKLSLRDVYKITGISDSKLSRIENENNLEPEPTVLKALSDCYALNIVDLYIRAGYIDVCALNKYKYIFDKADLLTEEENKLIQDQIYLFTKGRIAK